MINKINSHLDISVYNTPYYNHTGLIALLNDNEEAAWLDRGNGFKECIIKTANIRGLNLENRKLQIDLFPELKHYCAEKSMQYFWFNDNVFLKILNETSYDQNFTNPLLQNTIVMIYVVNDGFVGGSINFVNKGFSQSLAKENLIIFPSSEEYAYSIQGVESGEMIVGISYTDR